MSEIPSYYPESAVNPESNKIDFEAQGDVIDSIEEILVNLSYESEDLNRLAIQALTSFNNQNYEATLDILDEMTGLVEDEGIENIFTLISLIGELV